jgi:Leucine-rich repeat (LRR) protein
VALLIAVAVAGICGTGSCSSPKPSPVPMPVVPSPMLQPVPVPVSIIPANTAPSRADTILPYINSITLSGRTLTYPSSSSAEERAIQWLVEVDLGTFVDDEPSLRQRYVLSTLWFLQSTPTTTGFGTAEHAATWTTDKDECDWLGVWCDDNGHVNALNLGGDNVRGQIPHDLGLLTGLTYLALWNNQLSGTIPSSLGALTALTGLHLEVNRLSGTIPSSLGALTALEELFLYRNLLVGSKSFCNSDQSLDDLVADCARVDCTCCTECCPAAFGNIPRYTFCEF